MNDRAEDLAYGRWPEILAQAGVDASCFSGKHGPCPLCGGRDRYRWSKKEGGLWVCNHCTQGKWADGFRMLMALRGTDFRGAADYVRSHFGGVAPRPVVRRPAPADEAQTHARNMQRMEAIWSEAQVLTDDDPVMRYLRRRVPGLNFAPRFTRYHPRLGYWVAPSEEEDRPKLLGYFPAMVVKAFDPLGRFVQLHKTYLTQEGLKADVPVVKKTERGIGVNGFAVPMQRVQGHVIGFAEGIESALAATMLREIPVWPCLNGPSLAAFDLPASLMQQIEQVVVFADNDERKLVRKSGGGSALRSAGLHYAEQLAQRIRSRGKRVLIMKAGRVGFDMADHWERSSATA